MNHKQKLIALGMALTVIVISCVVFYARGFSYTEQGAKNDTDPINKEETEDELPVDTTPLPTVMNSSIQNGNLENGNTDDAIPSQEDPGNNNVEAASSEESSDGHEENTPNNQGETNPPDNNPGVQPHSNELPLDLN